MKGNEIDAITTAIVEFLKPLFSQRDAEIADTKSRVAALEATRVKFMGTWNAGQPYTKGDLVTRQGSLWACRRDTDRAPGSSPECWSLAVKSGDK